MKRFIFTTTTVGDEIYMSIYEVPETVGSPVLLTSDWVSVEFNYSSLIELVREYLFYNLGLDVDEYEVHWL